MVPAKFIDHSVLYERDEDEDRSSQVHLQSGVAPDADTHLSFTEDLPADPKCPGSLQLNLHQSPQTDRPTMKKGALHFLGRKNRSLFDTNIQIKDRDNVELVLGSPAILESGTASVRARPWSQTSCLI
ncbi:unnamed protein product [Pleuronectes platessa]|uniref:Uncharacterized protein n=1 Tax=Pleuronectes platessa TaxID=8262 RepID=A0A9N7TRP4_PLEPL|nr:unnamed protein product [Pleuronectes platessa]